MNNSCFRAATQIFMSFCVAGCVMVASSRNTPGQSSRPPRPPNPEVHPHTNPATDRRANLKRPRASLSDQIEAEIESGNNARDSASSFQNNDEEAQAERQRRQAEKHFRRALLLNPKESRAYYGLGNVSSDRATYSNSDATLNAAWLAAERAYKQAIRLKPDYADAHYGLGEVYSSERRDQEAIEQYKQAISFDPNYVSAYDKLGFAYESQRRYAEASEQFRKAISLSPDYAERYNRYDKLGELYYLQQRYPEAIEQYQQAIRLKSAKKSLDANGDPDVVWSYIGLARTYRAQQRYEEAIALFKDASRLNSKSYSPYNELGLTYYAQQRYIEAIEQYKQAIQIFAEEEIYYNLGLAYLKTNNKSATMEQYRALKERAAAVQDQGLKKHISEYADKLLSEINKQ